MRANHGSTDTRNRPRTSAAAPKASAAASSKPASSGITGAWKRRPSSVRQTSRGLRSNSRMPTRASSRATARLTPDGVRPRISAARAKFPASVTAAMTPTPVNSRVSKTMRPSSVIVISNHRNIDLNALKSCLASVYISVTAGRDGQADLKRRQPMNEMTRRTLLQRSGMLRAVLALDVVRPMPAGAVPGASSRRFKAIDADLTAGVSRNDVAGVVALAATRQGLIYEGAFGTANTKTGAPMTADTVFWLLSMTKALTATSCMQLIEQGRLRLGDEAAKYLP